MCFRTFTQMLKTTEENWTMAFMCHLYKTKSVSKMPFGTISTYRDRMTSDSNKNIFEVLAGTKQILDLNDNDKLRLNKILEATRGSVRRDRIKRRRGKNA